MKRLAAFTTRAALLGALLSVGTASHAQNVLNMYLVPISDLNGSYQAGDIISFAALVDIPANNFQPITLTLGPAVAYDQTVFDINGVGGVADTSAYPSKPSVHLWDFTQSPIYGHTATGPDGTSASALQTLQVFVGHTRDLRQPGNKVTSIPGGTYTIGTFSFPLLTAVDASHPTTIYLPTAYGFGGDSSATDFISGTDSAGTNRAVLAFPNTGGKYSQLVYGGGSGTGSTAFHITFQGLATNGPAQPVTVLFHPNDNSGDITKTGTASQTVNFSTTVAPNTYDIYVKSDKYLGVVLRGTVLSAAPATFNVILLPGDANNDNTVDGADFGFLVNAYGTSSSSSAYDASADFNSDSFVDIVDFNLLLESYGLTGYN